MARWFRNGLALIFVGLGLLACDDVDLYRNLSEREANEIIAILIFQNIDARKLADAKKEFYSVLVHEESLARAVEILRIQGYPRKDRESIGDIFKSSGLVPTPFEEQVRFIYAMNQELERTIALMPGVIDVRVHIVQGQPVNEGASSDVRDEGARASVLVNYDNAHDFTERVLAIRRLVSDAVSQISYDNVEVLATPVRTNIASLSKLQLRHILGIGVVVEDSLKFLILIIGLISVWVITLCLLAGVLILFPGGWRAILGALRPQQ